MNTDYLFVAGFVLLILSFLAFVGAFTHGHRPRLAVLLLVLGGGLLGWIAYTKPNAYRLQDLPAVVVRVAGQVLNQ